MKDATQLDKRMAVPHPVNEPNIIWRNARRAPFEIDGLYEPAADGPFRRMPADVADRVSEGVSALSLNTAGGRVRFVTDSPYVAIHAEMAHICRMDHMAFTGIYGFDCYIKLDGRYTYAGTFRPTVNMAGGYEALIQLPAGSHELMIDFPLYNGVDELYIGLDGGASLTAPQPYKYARPVVYYGSSITQGGCASRPGNSYQAMITRALDCDHINLGFSGNGRAEPTMNEYIAGLDMSVFVCDYDHNAPDAGHLKATHGRLYDTVRSAQPDTPIVFVTMPTPGGYQFMPDTADMVKERRDIIYATYERALNSGDAHVSFIDGVTMFDGALSDDCTVDGAHPNDLGFYRMAQVIGAEVRRWLESV